MDKRLLLVLPICLGILFGWELLVKRNAPTTPPATPASVNAAAEAGSTKAAPQATDAPKPAAPDAAAKPAISAVVADTEERRLEFTVGRRGTPGYYRAIFSNKGAVLEDLRSGNYFVRAGLTAEEQLDTKNWTRLVSVPESGEDPTRAFTLKTAASSAEFARAPLEHEFWSMTPLSNAGVQDGVEFKLAPGQGVTFVKRFRFLEGTDQLRFEFELVNDARADAFALKNFVLTPAAGVPNDTGDTFNAEPVAMAYSPAREGHDAVLGLGNFDAAEAKSGVLGTGSGLSFAGVYNKYFVVALRAADDASKQTLVGASWRSVRDAAWAREHPDQATHNWRQLQTDVDLQVQLPAIGASRTWTYDVYAGPKQRESFGALYADHGALLDHDLGYMRGLSKALIWVLRAFHSLTSSWGLAIIMLTITVRALLFPINRRAQTAMARYQAKIKRIQPKIDEIKKRYEKDPSKLRQEQARIMQEEEALVPPLGGCLPPLLQIPVFFGLMSVIRIPFELRQAPFMGWIHDLSLPDRLVRVDWHLPLLGHVPYLNVLPPLMVAVWILQQRSMPMPTDEQGKTMYKMMMFMPLVMGVFLYNYAAGMSLYMITQSTLAIIEQKIIRKYWPVDDKPLPKKKKSGFMARLMEQAQAQQKMKEQAQQRKASARR